MSTTPASSRCARPCRPLRSIVTVIFEARPATALAIFAHPDDPEVACAGTLAAWVAAGCEAHLVIANAGDKGTGTNPKKLARARQAEAEEAAAVLGLASLVALAYPDGELENTSELRAQLIRLIRSIRPDVVIAPD